MIDLHAHILPGVDDGSSDIDASVLMVRELANAGVTDIFVTPHYVEETIYTSPYAENLKLIDKLSDCLKVERIAVNLHLGNEIYITPHIKNLLDAKIISGLADSSYLLIELPLSGEFPGYADIFLELTRAGYKVVLAHPERYDSFQKDFSLATELFEMGVLFQSNVGSFAGQYGKNAMKLVRKLAKEGMVWGVGTDIHHPRGEKFLPAALKKMSKFYSDDELKKILISNPKKILD